MARNKLMALFGDKTAKTMPRNYENFPTFVRSLEEQTLQILTTNTLETTFYASAQTLAKETVEVCEKMAQADPELFAKMLVYARNEGLLRTAPITGLAVLSRYDTRLFGLVFPLVVQTPDDLKDFVTLVRKGDLRPGMGRAVKTAIGNWLNSLTEYHAIKYGSKGSAEFSLRDVLRLAHPKPRDVRQDALFRYLIQGVTETEGERPGNREIIRENLPQVDAFENLKAAAPEDTEAHLHWIEAGRLPYEVVVGAIKPDIILWKALLKQMPYMALLRHLNTLSREGVFEDREALRYVAGRLSDAKAVRKSRLLPFRFFTAYQMLEGPEELRLALTKALEISFANFPGLDGRVCIAPDVSGSMSYGMVGNRGKTRYIDIAALFTAALMKKSRNPLVLPFETKVVSIKFSAEDSLMQTAEKLARIGGGGTAVSAPISELLARKEAVDLFIGITDSEEWATDHYSNRGFLKVWKEYVRTVNPNAKAFLLTLAPYRHAVAPQSAENVHFIYGWSDSVLDYITWTAQGAATQLDRVRSTSLS